MKLSDIYATSQPDQYAEIRAAISNLESSEIFKRLTIGYCQKCGYGHSLINGLCYDCRPNNKEA